MNSTIPGRRNRRPRLILLAAIAVISLGAGFASLLFSTVLAAPAPAASSPRTIPLTDVNPYGANFFLEREVEVWKREKTLQMATDAGVGWARQQFPWEEIEPEKGQFNWSKYDDLVALYRKNGIQIIARLDRPPLWARTSPSGSGASGPPDDYETYGDFVDAFARHYQGQVTFLQIWNEPNLGREWNDAPIDPSAYVKLLKIAYTRAKAVDPNIRILTAPLAITLGEPYPKGEHVFRNMNDLQFLEEMYEAGAKDSFDILSANAFGLRSPPEDPPSPDKLNFQRVALERGVMEKNGDSNKSVWINEYGWNTSPESMPEDKRFWGRVTEEQQADYTIDGIEFARKNWPWVGVISVWYFRQVGDIPVSSSEYYFRMVDPDFVPRPVYVRFKDVAGTRPVAGPGQYQETNPALELSGEWNLDFDSRASLGQQLVSKDESATASVEFWGDALSLVVHQGPGLGKLYVKVDGQPVSGLPADPRLGSYVALGAEQDQWQVQVPVARGIERGQHTLTLAASGEVNLDGLVVPPPGSPDPQWPVVAPLFAAGSVAAFLLFRQIKSP